MRPPALRGRYDASHSPECVHRHEDATIGEVLDYTHVYIFDRVFSKRTLVKLATVLTRSPFLVLVSYRPCHEWWRYGLVKVQPVAKMRLRKSGGEQCNAYVYVNMEFAPGMGRNIPVGGGT